MFLIFAVILSTALANSHEKYIDLLPEEEKQEFLDKVARRILDTVDISANSDKSSKELNDEDLKEHDKFVQDILEEEKGHVRKRRADRKSEDEIKSSETSGQMEHHRADDRSSDDENNANEHLEVNPMKTESKMRDGNKIDKSHDSDNASFTDEKKQRSNDDAIQESPKDYIPVEIVTDKVLPLQQRSSNTDGGDEPKADVRTKKSSEQGMKKVEPKEIKTPVDVKTKTKQTKYLETTTKLQDLKLEKTNNTTPKSNEYKKVYTISNSSLANKNHSNKQRELKPTTEFPLKEEINIYILTSTTAKSETHTTSRSLESDKNSKTLVTSDEYSTIKPTPRDTTINSSNDDTTKDIFIDLATYLTTTKSPDLNKHTTRPPKVFKLKRPASKSPKKLATKKPSIIVLKPRAKKSKKSPGPSQTNIKATPNKEVVKIRKKSENTTIITYFFGETLKNHKSELDLTMPKPNSQDTFKKYTTLKPYQVFEIPWPDSSNEKPFLRNPEPMQDQPYFVPVYKYSPNYAFYNPTNRHGPNVVEENSIELDAIPLRKGKKKGKKAEANEFILHLNDELRKFGAYKKKPEVYTEETVATTIPGDPEDSKENTVMQFPDSYENLHPYNGMNNGLKTHIKAIRDVLFIKKVYQNSDTLKANHIKFLFPNESLPSELGQSDEEEFPVLRNNHNRGFDIDYYFKALQRLQDPNSNEVHDMNELLIISHANDKLHEDHSAEHKGEDFKDEPSSMNTISKILNVTDEKDVFTTLEKLQKLNLNLMRRNEDIKLGTYMKVLKDMIQKNSNALKQYDWLATTVQTRSASNKLSVLIERKRNSEPIHPADVQILKYAIFIHNFSLQLREANEIKQKVRIKEKVLPRGKQKKNKIKKEEGLIDKAWLLKRTLLPDLTGDDGLNNLHEFLLDVEDALFDLHEAITNIAKITSFKHQNWFENIKELYLTTDEKHLREVLLHLSFSRLVDLVEKSCETGLEKDFIQYMKTHKKESKRTIEEILFVLNILDQIKNNLE